MKTLKLGTRRSMLAWAQSTWIAREIERVNPGVGVELVGIETRGDRILDVPLSQVQGKEFFVAEIDEALLSGAVDLTVHSMKDLSLERPAGVRLAAAPTRENPRDVVIFSAGTLAKLRAGETLHIGTSAPRRLENIPDFLTRALPQIGPGSGIPRLELVEIRGNVNTRLARLSEPVGSPRALDAVVLAFAGLIRLWRDPEGGRELKRLLEGARWMVLPLLECPTAPAQGMLAVECRADDAEVFGLVGRINDAVSFELVSRERRLLGEWGGGCHQKFGATAITHERLGELFFIRGKHPDGRSVDELRWSEPARPLAGESIRAWDGASDVTPAQAEPIYNPASSAPPLEGRAVFVAHARAAKGLALEGAQRVWTSGTSSWFSLARRGVWVEGSAEGMGFDFVSRTLAEPVLRLPPFPDWIVLTHEGARSGWRDGQVVATYRLDYRVPSDSAVDVSGTENPLRTATHVYWTSGSQFEALGRLAERARHHACGPGKTAERLAAAGVTPTVFPSAEVWRRWIKT